MEHVVFFPAADGNPAFRRLPSLEDAVRFVEYLRNIEDVTEVSVHALTSVPLAVRTVYRVEVVADAPAAESMPEAVDEPMEAVEAVEAVEAPAEVAAEVATEVPAQAEPVADAAEMAMEAVEAVPVAVPVTEAAESDMHSLGFFAG